MKKSVQLMVFEVIVFAAVLLACPIAEAAEDWGDAMSVNVNEDFTGNVTKGSSYEQNRYMFDITEAGVVKIKFSCAMQGSTDNYWRLSLANATYKYIFEGSIKGNKEITSFRAIGLAPGTYYIKVCSASERNALSTDTYSININYEASENWEKEFNEDFISANPIKTNVKYYGTTRDGSNREEDYFLFETDKPGYVSIQFDNPQQGSTDDYWIVYLYNGAYKKIDSWYINGAYTTHELTKIGVDKGTYYLGIKSYNENSASYDIYGITVKYTQSENWEKEFNDSFISANTIKADSEIYGTIHDGGNIGRDYYRIEIPVRNDYRVCMRTEKQNTNNSYWKLIMYNSVYSEIESFSINGNKTETYINKVLEAGTYYVMVESADDGNFWSSDPMSTSPYILSVNSKSSIVPTPTASPSNPGSTTTDTSISKKDIGGVKDQYTYTGQEIRPVPLVYENNSQLNINTDYTVSYENNSNIGIGKIKITGIGKYNGTKKITFKIVPKGTEITKIKRLKAGFKVKWKLQKEQTDGYYIGFSTNNSFKNTDGKLVTSNSIKSYSIKGMSIRKKYYIRICTYKYVDGVAYYSKWSKPKNIKTKMNRKEIRQYEFAAEKKQKFSEDDIDYLMNKWDDNPNVLKTYYADYDGDGKNEVFAITGEDLQSQCSIHFASTVWSGKIHDGPSAYVGLKEEEICDVGNNMKLFIMEWGAFGSGSYSTCYRVSNGKPHKAKNKNIGGLSHRKGKQFYIVESAFDAVKDSNGNMLGHTYKRYWARWNGKKFVVYKGRYITKNKFRSFGGGKKILRKLRKKHKIGKIIMRSNGIININLYNVKKTQYGKETNYSNISYQLHGNKLKKDSEDTGIYKLTLKI